MVNKKQFKEDVVNIMRLRKKSDGAEGLRVKALILFQLKLITANELEDAYVAVARYKARYDCESSRLAEKYKGNDGLAKLYDSIELEVLEALRDHRHQDIQETYLFVLGKSGCDALAHYERKDFNEILQGNI